MSIKSEIRNNVAHFFTGFLVGSSALALFGGEYSGVIFAGLTGFGVEAYQLIGKSEPWWVIDRICDLLGYIIGGSVATLIFITMRWV